MEAKKNMRLTANNLHGRTMIAAGGMVIGEVVSTFLDCETWRVESLQVKLNGDIADQLGADHGIFHAGALEVPVRMVQSVGDTVILSVPVAALREILPPAEAGEASSASSASSAPS